MHFAALLIIASTLSATYAAPLPVDIRNLEDGLNLYARFDQVELFARQPTPNKKQGSASQPSQPSTSTQSGSSNPLVPPRNAALTRPTPLTGFLSHSYYEPNQFWPSLPTPPQISGNFLENDYYRPNNNHWPLLPEARQPGVNPPGPVPQPSINRDASRHQPQPAHSLSSQPPQMNAGPSSSSSSTNVPGNQRQSPQQSPEPSWIREFNEYQRATQPTNSNPRMQTPQPVQLHPAGNDSKTKSIPSKSHSRP